MKSFAEFLFETRFTRDGNDGFEHHAQVHGHDVVIGFSKEAPHEYLIAYDVNGKFNSQNHGQSGRHVLHHVHRKINDFIKAKGPRALSFSANEEHKEHLYHRLASRLAKHYGGEHKVYGDRFKTHTVYFPKRKSE